MLYYIISYTVLCDSFDFFIHNKILMCPLHILFPPPYPFFTFTLLSLSLLFLSFPPPNLIYNPFPPSFSLSLTLSLSGSHISHIAAGSQHILALSHTHELYTWGSGKHGQLGVGEGVFREEDCHIQTPTRPQVMCNCEYDIIIVIFFIIIAILL